MMKPTPAGMDFRRLPQVEQLCGRICETVCFAMQRTRHLAARPAWVLCTAVSVWLSATLQGFAAGSAPLTFTVTASGRTNQSLVFTGCHDTVTMNLTCTLQVQPHALTCDSERFHSESADVTGTVHFWGIAQSDCVGSLEFDITEPVERFPSATTSSFTPDDAG